MNERTITQCDLTFGQAWEHLMRLAYKKKVSVAEIPEAFREDLRIYYWWLYKKPHGGALTDYTYNGWIHKLKYMGLYYPIQFKTETNPIPENQLPQ